MQGSFYWTWRFRTLYDRDGKEGTKQGLEDGIRRGEMEGSRHGRCDGAEGNRVMWGLGHKRPQSAKNQQAKAEKAARKQGAAASAATSVQTQTHICPPGGVNSGEEPIVPQGPEWVDSRYEDRAPLVGIVIDEAGQEYFRSSPRWRSITGPDTFTCVG